MALMLPPAPMGSLAAGCSSQVLRRFAGSAGLSQWRRFVSPRLGLCAPAPQGPFRRCAPAPAACRQLSFFSGRCPGPPGEPTPVEAAAPGLFPGAAGPRPGTHAGSGGCARTFFPGAAPRPPRGTHASSPAPSQSGCLHFNASGGCLTLTEHGLCTSRRAWIQPGMRAKHRNRDKVLLGSGAKPERGRSPRGRQRRAPRQQWPRGAASSVASARPAS
jgi:hypothetical protein